MHKKWRSKWIVVEQSVAVDFSKSGDSGVEIVVLILVSSVRKRRLVLMSVSSKKFEMGEKRRKRKLLARHKRLHGL